MFPLYVDVTLHMLILSYKQGIICVSTKCRGSYDVY